MTDWPHEDGDRPDAEIRPGPGDRASEDAADLQTHNHKSEDHWAHFEVTGQIERKEDEQTILRH